MTRQLEEIVAELQERVEAGADIDWSQYRDELYRCLSGGKKAELKDEFKSETVDARSVLKILGAAAGTVAMSSAAAGWDVIRPSAKGKSGVDASTVDSGSASELGRDVRRDVDGNVLFTSVGTAKTTATPSTPTVTTQITDGRVVFEKLQASVTSGVGNAVLRRNGSTLNSGAKVTYTGTPRAKSATWTLEIQTGASGLNYQTTKTSPLSTTNSGTTNSVIQRTMSSSVAATMNFKASSSPATGKIYINSSLKKSTQVSAGTDTTINVSKTPGTKVTFQVTAGSTLWGTASGVIQTRTAKFYVTATNTTAAGQMTASRNDFMNIY